MVRTSVTHLILFVAVVSATTLFVGVLTVEVGLYSQSIEREGDRLSAEIDTEILLLNDREAGGTYDDGSETVTLYVKNVGGSTLEPRDLDILLDGEYVDPVSSAVVDGDHWREGDVLEVRIEHPLEDGTHRTVVRINGVTDRLEFEVGTDESDLGSETLVWGTEADWSAGTHERTVSDDVGDREADTVRLGYDAEDTGLVSYWPFGEATGDTAFDAAGENDGDHVNDPTLEQTGIASSTAYGFDGVDARVNVPNDNSLEATGDLTVSLWVKPTDLGTSAEEINQTYFLDKSHWDDREGYVIGDNGDESDEVFFRVLGEGDHWDVSFDRDLIEDGEWHNIVGIREGDTIRIYLDGELRDQTSGTALESADVPLSIGAGWEDGYGPLEGDIDEVQVYDRALSGSEANSKYRTGVDGTYTTGWKSTEDGLSVDDLHLENVSATLDGGNVTVYVESDATGDGEVDEVSEGIELTSDETYSVDGLNQDTDSFRLRLEFETADPTRTPVVSRIGLGAEPAPETPFLEVSAFDAPDSADDGETITVSALVENTGTETDTQTLEYHFDGTVENTTEVTLAPEESETVEFTHTVDADDGTYQHGVYSDDSSDTAAIDVGDAMTLSLRVDDLAHEDLDDVEYVASYEVENTDSSFSHVSVRFENLDEPAGSQTIDSSDPRGHVRYENHYGFGQDFEITVDVIADDPNGGEFVAVSDTISDTANTENPAENDELGTVSSPELTTWEVDDTSDGSPTFEVTYDLSSTSDFTELELLAIGADNASLDRTTTTAESGTVTLDPSYGLGEEFVVVGLVFDDERVAVDTRRTVELADGS